MGYGIGIEISLSLFLGLANANIHGVPNRKNSAKTNFSFVTYYIAYFQKYYNVREKHGYHQQRKCCPSVIPNQSNKIKNNYYDRRLARHKSKAKEQK